ncbi:MAG: 16S rRNA (guanine(966)-N(2))-methyltransferase RsmD [candidate division Zixibacteria bacterium]|nr:16S rRNA (guanine(966)-N(2))-methyltransferase RsmD [candidate division Zixibacteria bacterium]
MTLRVGSGKFKGRRLSVPRGPRRFSSGRTKKGLFDFLSPYLEDALVLDLFAGTGGLGVEALSRGARFCLFVEIDAKAVAALKENLSQLFPPEQYEVRKENFREALEHLFKTGRKFDLILADPPYRQEFLDELSSVWRQYSILQVSGILALEHSKRTNFSEPENLELFKARRYGDTIISYFRPKR